MKLPLPAVLALMLGVMAVSVRADPKPEIVPLGRDTYALTQEAGTGFARNTEKLKAQALEEAAAYCAKLHKELKVVSTTTSRPKVPLLGFASAKVVFKALDANDPELHAPEPAMATSAAMSPTSETAAPPSATEAFYRDLTRLGELRKQGLLTDEEFQTLKKKLLEKYP